MGSVAGDWSGVGGGASGLALLALCLARKNLEEAPGGLTLLALWRLRGFGRFPEAQVERTRQALWLQR